MFSKIFTGILNKRLTAWTDTQEIITDDQAGFRKGYSTVDNAFVLHSVIHRHLNKSKKVYAAFIDFRKAFDSVKRETLWNVLQKNGINGKMLTMIKSIYNIVLSCVRCPYGKTIFSTVRMV